MILLVGCFAFQRAETSLISSTDARTSPLTALSLDQSSSLCPQSAEELRSLQIPSARKTITQFHNSASDLANVFWYNHHGVPSFKAAIPANGYWATTTWEGHAFRVWNKDLTVVLLDFKVGRKAFGSDATRSAKIDLDLNSTYHDVRVDLPHLDWDEAREVGFVNRMNIDLDLYFVDWEGEEILIVSKLVPGDVVYEITYHMHRFRARVHGEVNGNIVKELQIGDIEIPDCELPKQNKNNRIVQVQREPVAESGKESSKDDSLLTNGNVKKDLYSMDVLSWTLSMVNSSTSCYSLSL